MVAAGLLFIAAALTAAAVVGFVREERRHEAALKAERERRAEKRRLALPDRRWLIYTVTQ